MTPHAVDLTKHFGKPDLPPELSTVPIPNERSGTIIICLNAPELPTALAALGLFRGRRWRVIGYWAWELPCAPPGWANALSYVHEVWVPSRFTADALRGYSRRRPIRVMPLPVVAPTGFAPQPPENRRVLVAGDGRSSFTRKNLQGAIRAFREASVPGATLTVKTRNLAEWPAEEAFLRDSLIGLDATLLDANLNEPDKWALLNAHDVYLSLHRAEGFGLIAAEMMALGKVVILTGWSGTEDFADPGAVMRVDYQLEPQEDRSGSYTGVAASWATPSHAHAVACRREALSDRELRLGLGVAAQHAAAATLSPERIGHHLKQAVDNPDIAGSQRPWFTDT